jgi:serine/threonine protein kinase
MTRPVGFQVEDYRILGVLARGGFSTVYLAHDEEATPVALKEYRPLAPGQDAAAWHRGMQCFFEEGRTLAGLNHPNVVHVLNFFRAHDTAYLAMRYEVGRSLQEHIERRASPFPEPWLRWIFVSLLRGLREVHSARLLHLDIKPGNIYVRHNGMPMLIDFGSARAALSPDRGLAPIYTSGFASPEHHDPGPWSDIYSVGASLYACLAGAPPLSAAERLKSDQLVPARRRWAGKYSDKLLAIVDWCLRIDAKLRPQSVLALQKALAEGMEAIAA